MLCTTSGGRVFGKSSSLLYLCTWTAPGWSDCALFDCIWCQAQLPSFIIRLLGGGGKDSTAPYYGVVLVDSVVDIGTVLLDQPCVRPVSDLCPCSLNETSQPPDNDIVEHCDKFSGFPGSIHIEYMATNYGPRTCFENPTHDAFFKFLIRQISWLSRSSTSPCHILVKPSARLGHNLFCHWFDSTRIRIHEARIPDLPKMGDRPSTHSAIPVVIGSNSFRKSSS